MKNLILKAMVFCFFASVMGNVSAQTNSGREIEAWITKNDRSALFEKQQETIPFSVKENGWGIPIVIDERQTFQTIDGFGFALTGGSAELLSKMDKEARSEILHELFDSGNKNIGVSYIRLSIGASDLNSFVYSYDDLEDGETDFDLKNFSLAQDLNDVVPVMKEILAINPEIKILGS